MVARRRTADLLAALLLLGAAPAAAAPVVGRAHPLHTTLTQVKVDPRDQSVIVTVRAFADDLGTVVGRFAHVTPGPTHEVPDAAVSSYVAAQLSLENAAGRVPLVWEGAKRTGDLVWITLRSPARVSLDRARIRNAMLCELYVDQINIVQAELVAGRSRSVLLTKGDGAKAL